MMRLIWLPLLFLAGCATPPTLAPQPPIPASDTCGAAPHASLVGQDATALERVLILRQVRVIRPGQAVTLEFLAERLNFHVGENGRITHITCG